MGFPAGYTELLLLPKFLIHVLSLLSISQHVISTVFRYQGLRDFSEPTSSSSAIDSNSPAAGYPEFQRSISAFLIYEILPVVKFADLIDPPESCAVCLYEFKEEDVIRSPANFLHVFHWDCLDRWTAYKSRTCPM